MEEEKCLTKLSLTVGESTMSWETPHDDCTSDDLVKAFFGICKAQTWHPDSIIRSMQDFIDDYESL